MNADKIKGLNRGAARWFRNFIGVYLRLSAANCRRVLRIPVQVRAGLAGAGTGTVFFVVGLQPERGRYALGQVVEIAPGAELLERGIEELAAIAVRTDLEDHELDAALLPVERRAHSDFRGGRVEPDFAVGRLERDGFPVAFLERGCDYPAIGSGEIADGHQWRCTSAAMILSRICSTVPRP